jgi:simple sugar transport system ATP-binding protein
MQILYGFYHADSGEIAIGGEQVRLESPKEAIRHGIGMVHQEFMLVRPFSVVENVVLGLREGGGPFLDLAGAAARLVELSDRHGLAVDPHARIENLPVGVQQRVEILKLLYREAWVFILDEPTAVLTPQEAAELVRILRNLAAEGHAVVIVTHKLQEVMAVADRVTVMRDGRSVATVPTSEVDEAALARMMVGRDVALRVERTPRRRGDPVLRVSNLHVRDSAGHEAVRGIDLTVHEAEILGIAGVDGNGQSELAEAIMNIRPVEAGEVRVGSHEVTHLSPSEHHEHGLAHIPADRRHVGSVAELGIDDNAILGEHRNYTWLNRMLRDEGRIRRHAEALVKRFDVRTPGITFPAGKLSGGNLQKLVLGREMMRDPRALVVEQPTRGLDVGAIEAIWAELLAARGAGKAILLISAELEEILNLADRVAVIHAGRIMGIVDGDKADLESLGLMMAGRASAGEGSASHAAH